MVTTRTKDYPYYIKSESKESYFITKILLIYTILILMLLSASYYNYINDYITILKDILIIYIHYIMENLQFINNL